EPIEGVGEIYIKCFKTQREACASEVEELLKAILEILSVPSCGKSMLIGRSDPSDKRSLETATHPFNLRLFIFSEAL
ncbi:hypothetical protein JRQ81_013564, partial [Phrynocephalus forsythii]